MNRAEFIRNACLAVKVKGLKLKRGPWFDISSGEIKSCCAIGAVLLTNTDFKLVENSTTPGYTRQACELLDVDAHWLVRFWMGFDRGHQVMLINDKDKEIRDEVSALGIQLAKELAD